MSEQVDLFTEAQPERVPAGMPAEWEAARAAYLALGDEKYMAEWCDEREDWDAAREIARCVAEVEVRWLESACWMIAWAMEETR